MRASSRPSSSGGTGSPPSERGRRRRGGAAARRPAARGRRRLCGAEAQPVLHPGDEARGPRGGRAAGSRPRAWGHRPTGRSIWRILCPFPSPPPPPRPRASRLPPHAHRAPAIPPASRSPAPAPSATRARPASRSTSRRRPPRPPPERRPSCGRAAPQAGARRRVPRRDLVDGLPLGSGGLAAGAPDAPDWGCRGHWTRTPGLHGRPARRLT